jgi:tRNA1(Val) A37 N6-methylase TrmN6
LDSYREESYGQRIAGIYDAWYGELDDAVLAVLLEFARAGRVLELGIGTGRIALPLHQAGSEKHISVYGASTL